MLADARQNRFDVVLAEALDRISRDQEHTAGIWKGLSFSRTKLVTLAEGEISELHVGLKGTMNALFLKDLAAKTHRGLAGRVEAGKSGGGICYGYDVVRGLDARGELQRGDRTINAERAEVVRRIFKMFADGSSPIAIAKALNAENIPGPENRAWRDTTIRGHAQRGTGILRNELYVGQLVWNRMHFVRDPATGKRVSRLNPPDQWTRTKVPQLRIVDQELWETVQMPASMASAARVALTSRTGPKFWEDRRSIHLLSQKVFCGGCGGSMTNIGRDYLACSSARKQGVCSNSRGIRRSELETLVLEALRNRLMQPELVAEFIAEFTTEWNRALAQSNAGREAEQRELATVERKLTGLINALADGFRAPGLQAQLDTLEGRRFTLKAKLASPAPSQPRLHPNLAELYRGKVERLHEALRATPDAREALDAARGLIERIIISSTAAGKGFEIELVGEIAAMIGLCLDPTQKARQARVSTDGHDLFLSSIKVVAGACIDRQLTLSVVVC